MRAIIFVLALCAFGAAQAGTIDNSSQSTQSTSKDKSTSKSTQAEKKASKSASIKLSVNAELLSQYVNAFERGPDSESPCGSGYDTKPIPYRRQLEAMIKMAEHGAYIQPISNPRNAFPVYNNGDILRADQAKRSTSYNLTADFPPAVTEKNRLVRAYIFEFAYANAVLSQAAELIESKQITSEGEARQTVKRALCDVDYSKAYAAALELTNRSKCLGEPLPQIDATENGFSHPLVLDCGTIYIDADHRAVRILGRSTLEQSMIDGRDITLTIARDESESTTSANTKSKTTRDSNQTTKQKSPE